MTSRQYHQAKTQHWSRWEVRLLHDWAKMNWNKNNIKQLGEKSFNVFCYSYVWGRGPEKNVTKFPCHDKPLHHLLVLTLLFSVVGGLTNYLLIGNTCWLYRGRRMAKLIVLLTEPQRWWRLCLLLLLPVSVLIWDFTPSTGKTTAASLNQGYDRLSPERGSKESVVACQQPRPQPTCGIHSWINTTFFTCYSDRRNRVG